MKFHKLNIIFKQFFIVVCGWFKGIFFDTSIYQRLESFVNLSSPTIQGNVLQCVAVEMFHK